MPRPLPVLIVLLFALCGTSAWAAEHEVTRRLTRDLDQVQTLRIDGGVGTMDIEPAVGDTLSVEVEIEGERTGLLRRKRDVSAIDLEQALKNGELRIGLNAEDHDDLEVHWRIRLPAVATTSIHLGVGQVVAHIGATALEVHVGVGEVDITGSRLDAGHVEVSAGVGSASLHGARDQSSQRAFVAESAEGHGEGSFPMDISVGVGDASVLLVDET
ncbi:MAG: hypothetical protein RL572_1250 [Pseudomonadota bacterium]|jgi:hypothetical protein